MFFNYWQRWSIGYQIYQTSYASGQRQNIKRLGLAFHCGKPALPPWAGRTDKVCRYYSLATYIERGMTVDDITTAFKPAGKCWATKRRRSSAFTDKAVDCRGRTEQAGDD
jgi:hypothetical protein